MTAVSFFKEQSKITELKTTIFEEYITSYILRKSTDFTTCNIIDLFCGAGKNGNKLGSPLIILNIVKTIFKLQYIRNSFKIQIFFNDIDPNNIQILYKEISKLRLDKRIKIQIFNSEFHKIYPKLLSEIQAESCNLFLLDPFGYSAISMDDLQKIFSKPHTEIFLFIPVFYAYRFSSWIQAKGKVKDFLTTYTTKGLYRYKNIYTFTKAIITKISNVLNTKYIREFILRDKSQVNSLFLITKDEKSMLIANNIFWQHSLNGKEISSSYDTFTDLKRKFNILIDTVKRKLSCSKKNIKHEIFQYMLFKGLSANFIYKIIYQLSVLPKYKKISSQLIKYWYNIYKI